MASPDVATAITPAPPALELPDFVETILGRAPFLRAPVEFGFRFANRWNDDACPLMAAALAFFGLLSMFPLALAGVALLARTLAGDKVALADFSSFVASFFPGAAGANLAREIERGVQSIAANPHVTRTSVFALISLLWAGRAYFDVLATVLNRIFPGAKPRSFLSHQLTLWGLLFGAGALFLLSSVVTFGLSLLQTIGKRLPDFWINGAPVVFDLLGKGAGYALTFTMFYLLYRFTPNRKVAPRSRPLLIAATVGALGWELGKWAFGNFLGNVTRYEAAYGSVAGVVVTMLWIYYASMIVLLGAEVGATIRDAQATRAGANIAGRNLAGEIES